MKTVINRYHPTEVQIKALELVKKITSVRLYSICEDTPLNDFVELAPVINPTKTYVIEEKPQDRISDWLELPEIQPAVTTNIQKEPIKTHHVINFCGIRMKFRIKNKST